MKKRSSAPARIVAVTALAVAAVVVIAAIGAAIGGDSSSGGGGKGTKSVHSQPHERHVPASYEIQSGDTLISIAHRTGVPVRTIEALNPQVDPQILIAGETLKLR